MKVKAPNFGSLVGVKSATAVTIAKSEVDVPSQLRVVRVSPSTHQTYEGAAKSPADLFEFAVPAVPAEHVAAFDVAT